MSFAFPSLLWFALPLLAATLAIHLLNLRRQQPVAWAAMEFLLESERLNRTWINLKQWLLLALRMLAIGLAVFALARPLIKQFDLGALAGQRAMHLVVLDDSYSMSDHRDPTSAWRDALEAVDRVLAFAGDKSEQQVVVLRSSECLDGRAVSSQATGAEEIAELRQKTEAWTPTQAAGGLDAAIEKATRLAEQAPTGVRTLAYVVTDGRRRDAAPLAALQERLETLRDAAQVRWVSCAASQSNNLTVTDLSLMPGPQTAGVELGMSVSVANHGPKEASGVLVQVQRDGRSSPSIDMGVIRAGETATRRFAALFREPGVHRVQAQLEPDSVAADNTRYAAFTLAATRKVLLIDGSPGGREGLPYATALRPSRRLNTGWRPELVTVEEVAGQTDFAEYAALFLLDAPKLSEATAAALKEYVKHGGGLFLAVGPNAEREFYNRWLLGDSPDAIAPISLLKPVKPPAADQRQGDLTVSDHPLFRVFSGDRDSFLDLVAINYLYGTAQIDPSGPLRVLAFHASGAPLLVERGHGAGRALVMLTTAGQSQRRDESWSNLSTLPVFPVLVHELAAYLAHPEDESPFLLVGEPWSKALAALVDARVRIGRLESGGAVVQLAEAAGGELASLPDAQAAGVYQTQVSTASGVQEQTFAINVDPLEGDLRLAPADELTAMLGRLGVPMETAVALSTTAADEGPSPLPPILGLLVVALLLGEQMLAISASYHEPRRGEAV